MGLDIAHLLDNPALLRAVLAFNGLDKPRDFCAQKTPETEPVARLLARYPRLWRLGLPRPEAARFWDFGSDAERLALLPPETQDALCLYVGAAARAQMLCRVVDGAAHRQLRAELGEALYDYLSRRGRFQLGAGLRQALLLADREGGLSLASLTTLGRHAFSVLFFGWPEALQRVWLQRWELATPSISPIDVAWREKIALWFKRILLREVAPSWQPCFNW